MQSGVKLDAPHTGVDAALHLIAHPAGEVWVGNGIGQQTVRVLPCRFQVHVVAGAHVGRNRQAGKDARLIDAHTVHCPHKGIGIRIGLGESIIQA